MSAPPNQRIVVIAIRLLMMDWNMVNAANGGVLMDKTLAFGTREGVGTSRVVSKVGAFDNIRLENQLTKLASLVRQLAVGQHQQITQPVCGICASVEHPTNMCPTL
ncbi:hypothetical protein CR513_37314, partial [Mucuna pruriens]